jgi:sulfate transport system ATP-binding protein
MNELPMTVAVTIESIEKRFGRFPALRGVDLEIQPGELVALLGPSGSGKTTLLRLIAGLEQADHGRVLFGDTDMRDLSLATGASVSSSSNTPCSRP